MEKDRKRQSPSSENLFHESERLVQSGYFEPHFVKPAYDSFCFSNLPGFIEATLTGSTAHRTLPSQVGTAIGDKIEKIVFVFLDAFGWEALERFEEGAPFLKRFRSEG